MVRETIQKKVIKKTLESLQHATAEEIYEEIKQEYPTISKATLYRNLKTMEEGGILIKVDPLDGRAVRYDSITHHHYHGECKRCHKIFDVDLDKKEVEALTGKVKDDHGFSIESPKLMFVGLCARCKKEKETENERS